MQFWSVLNQLRLQFSNILFIYLKTICNWSELVATDYGPIMYYSQTSLNPYLSVEAIGYGLWGVMG